MKILITISTVLLPYLQILSQNIYFEKKASIDSIVNKYATEYSIVGLSIGVTDSGNEFQYYGNTNLSNRYIVSDSKMFHLASISKRYSQEI